MRSRCRRGGSVAEAETPDDIVITSGAKEAVYLSVRAVTRPGEAFVHVYVGVAEMQHQVLHADRGAAPRVPAVGGVPVEAGAHLGLDPEQVAFAQFTQGIHW